MSSRQGAEGACPGRRESDRRRFLGRVIGTIHTAIAGTLGAIAGGAIFSPASASRGNTWLAAASLTDLPDNRPTPVMLRVARQDGYTQTIDRRLVFLVKTGDAEVLALDSTCTHLGCRVSWNGEAQELQCPCHGGRFDRTGAVIAGPPPAPLARYSTRLHESQILVNL